VVLWLARLQQEDRRRRVTLLATNSVASTIERDIDSLFIRVRMPSSAVVANTSVHTVTRAAFSVVMPAASIWRKMTWRLGANCVALFRHYAILLHPNARVQSDPLPDQQAAIAVHG
jgi:hypothetical protein